MTLAPRRFTRAAGLSVLSLTMAFASGCSGPVGRAPVKTAPGQDSALPRVTTVRPVRIRLQRLSEQPGEVEAAETTPIHAKLAGYVESVAVDLGDRVKRGQVLAVLWVPETEADLRMKRASIRQAEAERRQGETNLEVSRAGLVSARAKVQEVEAGLKRVEADRSRWQSESARVEQLFRERALTGSLLDETRSKLQAAEAGRDELKAKAHSAEAAVGEADARLAQAGSDLEAATTRIDVARHEAERAEAMTSYLQIRAPFDGVVTRRRIDPGHLTNPSPSGEPLIQVARTEVVTITVDIPETEAPYVNPGDPARVRLPALNGRTFEGPVTRTAWALNPGTRTLRAEIDLPNPEDALRPGYYAFATIVAEEHPQALTVPTTALVSAGGTTYCMTVAKGQARRIAVKLGLSNGSRTEILSGLDETTKVVEANASRLADGQAVQEQESEAPTALPRPKT